MMVRMRWVAAAVGIALIAGACSSSSGASEDAAGAADATALADARAAFTGLLGEHVLLAASATGAALGGRAAEFGAAAAALEDNSRAISEGLAAPLGKTPAQVFELWDGHIQMVVRYTQATAAGDERKQRTEVDNLLAYAEQFGTVINAGVPSLPADGVAELVTEHITTLKAVIDAQAAGRARAAYRLLHEAYAHMDMIGAALAGAIVA